MNVLHWASYYPGRLITAPGGAGGQCVDIVNVYVSARGLPLVRLNAADWARPGTLPGWRWVPNGPANYPALGDVVVWSRDVPALGIGPYGHIAVAMAGDPDRLLSLDQDWPVGSPVALTWHTYKGVAGWWTPPR